MKLFCFVDEDEIQGAKYAKALSSKDYLVEHVHPESDVAFIDKLLRRSGLIGILLDYKLSYKDLQIGYDAPTLAAHIREKEPNIPLIILSGILPRNRQMLDSYARTEELFDLCLDKAQVSEDIKKAQKVIVSVAEGYKRLESLLKRCKTTERAILKAVDLQNDPDGTVSWIAAESEGKTYVAASILIKHIFVWSGPLLSLKQAAVFLGVSPEESRRIVKSIEPAIYEGVFRDLMDEDKYWAAHLASCNLPRNLKPATCAISGDKANVVCDVCGDSFNSFYTVGVMRIGALAPVEKGRICGICAQGDHEGLVIRPESEAILESVIAETKKKALEKPEDGQG